MYDSVIIGSGPAGLSAAVYASRSGLDFVVVEKEYMGTGQVAFTERVDNYLGYYGIDGFSLGEKFREHAQALGTEFIEDEVKDLVQGDDFWKVILSGGDVLETRTVIYACGAYPRKLGIKGESELSGRGVSYCALCDGAFFSDKTVAVIGGGDTALEDALYLSKTSDRVYIIHRRDTFRASRAVQENIRNIPNIELILNALPLEITGTDKVTGINVLQNGMQKTINAEGIFIAVGSVPNTAVLRDKIQLDEGGYAVASEDCITSAKGLFVAGDVRTKNIRQLVTAASDGANAAISAYKYINR